MRPLADRIRPKLLSEFIGQDHIVGEGKILNIMLRDKTLRSMILYGPPGTGKTTLAEIIARETNKKFISLNATSATVANIRKAADNIDENTIVFLDEIYRFSRPQQDVLLPFLENGTITLIGASTENPYHSLSNALLSRCHVFELNPFKEKEILKLILRAVNFYKQQDINISVTPDAAQYIMKVACGDGRRALTIIEISVENIGIFDITLNVCKEISPSRYMAFNNRGDMKYDHASAFQGSIQASDPDAAIYWLAEWLESGEDPRYIARRLLVSAAEDAASNPICVAVAHAAYLSAEKIGRPECDILLAHATVLVASSPRDKSAAYAIWEAVKDIKNGGLVPIPKSMRDNHYPGAAALGNGAHADHAQPQFYAGIEKKYYKPWT